MLIRQPDGQFLPTSVFHNPQQRGITGIFINTRVGPATFKNMLWAAREVVRALPQGEQLAMWIMQGDPAGNRTAQPTLVADFTTDRGHVVRGAVRTEGRFL